MNVALAILLPLADNDFGHMGDWGAGWWILMMLGMILFWGLVILGVIWIVRELAGPREHGAESARPLDVLDRRLASGEISPEEYEERRRILRGQPHGG